MAVSRVWRWIGGIIGLLVVVVGMGLVLIYSGIINVAANYPDPAPVAWLLSTTSDHSIPRHAAGIKVPALNDPGMIQRGSVLYRGLCVECHGAPGVDIDDVGKGLNPLPPELVEAVKDWKPNELFWITKNGIRMTGMPAWGVSYADNDLWALVAFMQQLPSLTPAAYQAMGTAAPVEAKPASVKAKPASAKKPPK